MKFVSRLIISVCNVIIPFLSGIHTIFYSFLPTVHKLCRTENFLDYHDGLKEFITVKLNAAVEQLFGEKSVLFKEKINFKLAGGAGFKPHQDAPAW